MLIGDTPSAEMQVLLGALVSELCARLDEDDLKAAHRLLLSSARCENTDRRDKHRNRYRVVVWESCMSKAQDKRDAFGKVVNDPVQV